MEDKEDINPLDQDLDDLFGHSITQPLTIVTNQQDHEEEDQKDSPTSMRRISGFSMGDMTDIRDGESVIELRPNLIKSQEETIDSPTSQFKKPTPEDQARDRALYGKLSRKTINKGYESSKQAFIDIESFRTLQKKPKKLTSREKLVIQPQNKAKQSFDVLMLLLISYSCFSSMFQQVGLNLSVAFGQPPLYSAQQILDTVIECIFLVDLIMNFFVSYRDPQTFQPVLDLNKTAKRYLCGYFLIDFVSIFPFGLFLRDNVVATKLLRFLRLPRLLKMIKLDQCEKCAKVLFEYSSRNDRIIAQQLCIYGIRIIRTLMLAAILTYFLACAWYFISDTFNGTEDDTFIHNFLENKDYTNWEKLTVCCYFVLTTLSTVGYGDLTPQSDVERVFSLFFMLIGAGFFSIVLSSFIDIITNFDKKMGMVDKALDLHNWLLQLSSFTNGKPLPRHLLRSIEEHFEYFWKQDRIGSFTQKEPHLEALPDLVKNKILTNYLFSDIFFRFRHFFQSAQFEDSSFLYHLAFGLLPRHFPHNYIIYDEMDQVQEMYLVLKGTVNVGFRIGQREKFTKRFERDQYFAAYYCITNQMCEFLFKTFGRVKLLAIKRDYLRKILAAHPYEALRVKEAVFSHYQNKTRGPLLLKKKQEVEIYNKINPYSHITIHERQETIPELEEVRRERFEQEQPRRQGTEKPVKKLSVLMEGKIKDIEGQIASLGEEMESVETDLLKKIQRLARNLQNK